MSDIEWVLIIGLVGGLVHDILNGSLTAPILDKSTAPTTLKIGSIGDLILGAGAAFVSYATTYSASSSLTFIQLSLLAFTAGIGGSAILKAYANGQSANLNQSKLKAANAFAKSYKAPSRELTASDESERMAKFLEILG